MSRCCVMLLALVLVGCRGAPEPLEVPDPDLTGMEPQVVRLIETARDALEQAPESAEAWGELGATFDAHALFPAAESCYRQAHALDGEAFRWIYLLAIVREVSGAPAEELTPLFRAAAESRPGYAGVHVRLGDALSLRGQYEQARAEFLRAVELEPREAVAWRGLGQVRLALGDAQGAVESLKRAAELEPRDLAARSSLAQAYMRLGQAGPAEATLAGASDLQAINAMDDPVFEQQVFLRSVSSTRVFGRALMRLRDGDYDRAIEDLEIVREARPEDSASVHYWMGTAYQRSGRWQAAIEQLSRAVELKPGMVNARVQLGELFARTGSPRLAVEQYREALRLRPEPDTHYNLAELYVREGETERALEHLEAAVRLDGAHPARARLAELRARRR